MKLLLCLLLCPFWFFIPADSFNETLLYTIITPRALTKDVFHKFYVQVKNIDQLLMTINSFSMDSSPPLASVQNFTITEQNGDFSFIEYGIPFTTYKSTSIKLQFLIYNLQDISQLLVNKTFIFNVLKNRFTFIETDKPLYKPNDLVRFRLLSVSPSTLHPTAKLVQAKIKKSSSLDSFTVSESNSIQTSVDEVFAYEWVRLESPSKIKMAEWKNLTWPEALKSLNFKLSDDPEFGTWNIIAKLTNTGEDEKEVQSFKVEKYVLPRFVIDVEPPSFMTRDQKFVTFSACAKYSTGKPMKGNASISFCLTSNYYYGGQTLRPCISDTRIFNGANLCEKFNLSTSLLQLSNDSYYQSQVKINLTFVEEGTKESTNKEFTGGELQLSPFKVTVDSGEDFKLGLPYYGVIHVQTHDGKPVANASLTLTVELSGENYARLPYLNDTYVTDANGIAIFSFIIKVNVSRFDLRVDSPGIPSIVEIKSVKKFQSPSSVFLQPPPSFWTEKTNPINCSVSSATFKLESNVDLYSKTVYAIVQSRGEVIDTYKFPAEEAKKVAECVDVNDDIKGHYKCLSKEKDRWLVKCLSGWTGYNCLTPVCGEISCFNGACLKPNVCTCVNGWYGESCDKCRAKKGCINGYCAYGDDCNCNKGWGGELCNETNNYTWYYPTPIQSTSFIYGYNLTSSQRNQVEYAGLFQKEFKLKLNAAIYPSARVVFYFVYNESELVTQSFVLDNYAQCFMQNPSLKMNFGEAQTVQPKTNLKLTVSNSAIDAKESKCGLAIRDIAMSSLGSFGAISKGDVSKKLAELTTSLTETWGSPYEDSPNCQGYFPYVPGRMGKRSYMVTESFDSDKSFSNAGIFVISNRQTPCVRQPVVYMMENMVQMAPAGAADVQVNAKVLSSKVNIKEEVEEKLKTTIQTNLRIFFPEVWKFDYIDSIEEPIALKAPDSMTTWIANLFCMTPQTGLQIAEPASLTVFQPFYMDVVLPYSLIRGEIAQIPVKIFNYLRSCYGLVVQVVKSDKFQLLSSPFTELCLCDDTTLDLQIKGTSIGKVNITLAAQGFNMDGCQRTSQNSDSSMEEQSSNVDINDIADALTREILFEPEGVPQDLTSGDLLCTKNDTASIKFEVGLKQSEGLIEDSLRGYVMWSGDVMGSTLSNLEQLIRMPYGCGEQNMVSLVPSIYVLQYFSSLKVKKPEAVNSAKNFISIGYNRQLKYRMKDGSYSAFGEADKIGSTWLTAFVYKSFVAASQFVDDIDPEILNSAKDYILSKQRSDGCFEESGRIFHSGMKGGLGNSESDNVSLTAYIFASFLENKGDNQTDSEVIKNAVMCLTSGTPNDEKKWNEITTYSIALRAYALNLYNVTHPLAIQYSKILDSREKTDKANRYWKSDEQNREDVQLLTSRLWYFPSYTSADVETTAYALLVRLLIDGKHDLGRAVPVIKWLTNQRNSIGGWYSTQDTILGLQAISTFSTFISVDQTDLQLSIFGEKSKFSRDAKINEDNKLLFNEVKVPVPETFEFKSTGRGCAMVQVNIKFNTIEVNKTKEAFTVDTELKQNKSSCNLAKLQICVATIQKKFTSNMAVVKVKLVSGWEVTKESKEQLKQSFRDGGLKRLEEDKGSITLYFDYFNNSKSCVEIEMKRKILVFDPKPGSLQVFDYYSPEIITEVFYPAFHPECNSSFSSEKLKEKTKILTPSCPKCQSISNIKNMSDLCSLQYDKIFLGRETTNVNNESVWMLTQYGGDSLMLAQPKQVKFLFPYECKCSMSSGKVLIVKKSVKKSTFSTSLYINKEYEVFSIEDEHLVINRVENLTCQARVEEAIRFYLKDPKYWTTNYTNSSTAPTTTKEALLVVESKEFMCAQCFTSLDKKSSAELQSFRHKDVVSVTASAIKIKSPDSDIVWSLSNKDEQKLVDKFIDTKGCPGCELSALSINFTQPIYLYTTVNWKLKLESDKWEKSEDAGILKDRATIRADGDFLILSKEAKNSF